MGEKAFKNVSKWTWSETAREAKKLLKKLG